ncbi:ABC transporter permease [Janthinobacterium sp.]|uniref:ABC transporter permease n=1 Tax=Janthinobacterium sp. TaxID=1871054 RepID=UPI00293D4258|nr:ABC transporter permease [Janthinobacterium sp.]
MFAYYFLMGLRGLRRSPALTALMVLTLAVGVAASVATLTIFHAMSGDPAPAKSARLFVPLLDNGPLAGHVAGEPPGDVQLNYRDARNLLAGKQGRRRTALFGVAAVIEPARPDLAARDSRGVAAGRDFFAMFEAPFRYGQGWDEAGDTADVIVLTRALAETLFGAVDPVGRRLRLMGASFQVVGVLERWRPVPRYYRLVGGAGPFGQDDEFFIPFHSAIRLHAAHEGGMSCQGDRADTYQGMLDSECTWLQFWFETDDAAGRGALQDYLDGYAAEQRKLGRLPRRAANRLYDVMEWLQELKVAGNDSRLAVWLSFGFLALCLVNTVGLLLAKFSARAGEIGIRRALGASRREIFRQFLIEAGVIGLAGGALGLLLALAALAMVARQADELARATEMDAAMLAATFALAVLTALAAGLLPTWRACRVSPALQLKSQ